MYLSRPRLRSATTAEGDCATRLRNTHQKRKSISYEQLLSGQRYFGNRAGGISRRRIPLSQPIRSRQRRRFERDNIHLRRLRFHSCGHRCGDGSVHHRNNLLRRLDLGDSLGGLRHDANRFGLAGRGNRPSCGSAGGKRTVVLHPQFRSSHYKSFLNSGGEIANSFRGSWDGPG